MTLETILNAAVNSMIRGHHSPHCFSSWIQGQGYIGKGDGEQRRDHLEQLERAARSEVENLGFANSYAEPGYEQPRKAVLFADWNKLPRNFDRVLEKAGYAVEWSDEWSTCNDCNRAVRTQPDGYCWTPGYREVDGDFLCLDCAKKAAE